MSTTLPLYWNLSSADKKERVDASVKLVSSVLEFQAQFSGPASPAENESLDGSDNGDDEKNPDSFDELNAEDVRYAIRRLVRGLASPRESSRLGFAVALTELLSRLGTVSAEQIISLVMSSSQTQGSMQGHEIRDQYFARLFGFVSIIQSGLLLRQSTLPTSGSNKTLSTTLEDFQTVSKELLTLADKKSWLKESCWWALGLQLNALASALISWKPEAFAWIASTIYSDKVPWSSEKLAFTVQFQRAAPSLQWKQLLAPTFKEPVILSSRNIPIVARLLRDTGSDGIQNSSVPWKPQLHYAWSTIFRSYFPVEGKAPSGQSTFQEFYRAAVDESLFSNTSSPERKSWGFSVFQLALETLPPSEIPLLFTQNFMRTWINQLSGSDRSLHKTARQVANSVQAVASKHPAIGFTLVLQLVGRHGSKQFDKITRTKTVENLIASANVEGVNSYMQFLRSQLLEESSAADAVTLDSQRSWAIDQLAALVKNTSVPRDDSWIVSIIELLIVHGFFSLEKKSSKSSIVSLQIAPKPAFSENTKAACRQKLYSCLADLTTQTTIVKDSEGKTSKHAGTSSQGETWLSVACKTAVAIGSDKNAKPINEVSSELAELRAKAEQLVSQLAAVETSKQDSALGCITLIQSLLLQTYDPEADVAETMESAIDSIQKLFPSSKKKKRKSISTSETSAMDVDEQDAAPIDEIVDILIGLLESSTSFSRSVATFALGHLTTEILPSTMEFILKQLDGKNLDDHSDSDDDEDEEDDEEDVDDDLLGDVEVLDDSDESSDDEEDSDSEASTDEVDDEDAGDIEADDELRQKIAAALNMDPDADDKDGEDEEMLDDDAMLKMDEQLAAVFRMQQGPRAHKKQAEDEKREAYHFKNRVLDFLEIFIKNQPSSPLTPTLIMPLIETIRAARSDEGQFTEKAMNLLGRISNLKQLPAIAGDLADDLVRQVQELHQLARKAPSSAFESTLSSASLYLSRVLSAAGQSSGVADAYRGSLADFITRKSSRLNVGFFQSWIKRQASVAWLVREELVRLVGVDNAVNDFRRMQAVQLLQDLLGQAQSLLDTISHPEIISLITSSRQVILPLLTSAAETTPSSGLNANNVKSILRCALQTVRLGKKLTSTDEKLRAKVGSVWRVEDVSRLLEQFEANPKFKKPSAVSGMGKELLAMVSGLSAGGTKTKKVDRGKEHTTAGKQANAKKVPASAPVHDADEAAPSVTVNGAHATKPPKSKQAAKRKADGIEVESGTPKKKKKPKVV
ncbi:hypothetical protein DL93DRAFT_2051556 [Clavulina sp. PMI_390]|nr:hypothetical protein DL93DRAFT_2051556 [Clavulina sp. PMI_390]